MESVEKLIKARREIFDLRYQIDYQDMLAQMALSQKRNLEARLEDYLRYEEQVMNEVCEESGVPRIGH